MRGPRATEHMPHAKRDASAPPRTRMNEVTTVADSKPRRMFVLADGTNIGVTFALVSSLFLLWGFCNGMIDVMDKHFQQELHLSLSQSAWVQLPTTSATS